MKPLMEQWHFDPLIILLLMGIIYLYYLITGFKEIKSTLYFLTGILLFILAECSPLNELGMHTYFSAHMIVHIVILLICGPLLVISLKPQTISPLYNGIFSMSAFFAKHSWISWICGVGIMWFWHIPAIFDGSMDSMQGSFSFIPVLHGGSMLLAGMLFGWPIFGPFKAEHLQPLSGIVYLFTACISCSLLGLLITFAPLNTWHHYTSMQMPSGNPWNISPAEDQQAAGLIMWVPCCFVYLSGCLYLLYRWFAEIDFPTKQATIKMNTSIIDHD
ncbi:MAG TPA: cytochrome c oxidase assembly protein [Mucilaginibacter sp.]